jgi:hypothetical protein
VIPKQRHLDALFDQRPLALTPRRIRHLHQAFFKPSAGLLLELLSERDREAYRGAGHVKDIVRQFAPQAHGGAFNRVLRHERRIRKHFVQVGADHTRLDNRIAVVNEHRHHPAWIHLLEFRRELLASRKAQVVIGPRQLFLRQHDADLLRAH